MKGEFQAANRREKVNIILNSIRLATSKGVGVDENKLTALQSIEWGVRTIKIREYIKDLVTAELIEYREGLLWATDQ